MGKKRIRLFILGLLLLSLVSMLLSTVEAANGDIAKVGEFDFDFKEVINNIRDFLLGTWLLHDANFAVVMRVLFWVFLFAVVWMVLTHLANNGIALPGHHGDNRAAQMFEWLRPRNIRLTIAVVFTLIGILTLPYNALMIAALQYGFIGAIIIMFPIYVLLGWAVWWSYQGDVGGFQLGVRLIALITLLGALWTTAEIFHNTIELMNFLRRQLIESSNPPYYKGFFTLSFLLGTFLKRFFEKWLQQ